MTRATSTTITNFNMEICVSFPEARSHLWCSGFRKTGSYRCPGCAYGRWPVSSADRAPLPEQPDVYHVWGVGFRNRNVDEQQQHQQGSPLADCSCRSGRLIMLLLHPLFGELFDLRNSFEVISDDLDWFSTGTWLYWFSTSWPILEPNSTN
jgi:hypothetical protein